MAQKSQHTSGSDDQPNPAPSSTEPLDATSSLTKPTSHPNSSPSAQSAKAADSNDTPDNAADSQPMTKSASSGSNPSTKDAMSGPSPYGTRSRNRGQARPNYAEDKDGDVDMYDAYPEKKDEEAKKSARQAASAVAAAAAAAPATSDPPRTSLGSSARKAPATDDSKMANATTATKDPAVGTATPTNSGAPTTSSAVASTTTTKKRKALGQPTTNGAQPLTNSSPAQQTTPAGTSTRRSAANTAAAANSGAGYRDSNMLSFEKHGAKPKNGKMTADDGTILQRNDHVYLVCEPPGEPYYLGRIMEFLHVQNDASKPVDALRINWYYRPKDIGKKVNDTRLVFASMHSDISPLTALRGKCQIRHKGEIQNLDDYRKTPDCFWFEKLYDRYIQKHYDVIPCSQIVNVPEKVKKVLDERWKFILVEQGRSKEFTSAVKLCKRCSGYCANNDSVDCAVCKQTYHMNCVRPPLLKKPSRGFAWACAACSRAQERKLEARHTPSLLDPHVEGEEEEIWDEEEEDRGADTNRTSPADGVDDTHQPATPEQIYQASLWPYRYLGIHCKPEDALDYDDRIYPRAGSRQGPKHQATVLPWPGRPLKLVKPLEIKKSGRKDGKPSKETLAAIEADKIAREKRPKWVQDEPPGYVARGEDLDNDDPDSSAHVLWKPADTAETDIADTAISKYMADATALAPSLHLPDHSTNLLDVALGTLYKYHFDVSKALKAIPKKNKSEFLEPELSTSELKKFEEGISKFGSELFHVTRLVKNVPHGDIVRFYYTWKKSTRGKQIWGNFTGRKGKKEAKKAEASASKLQDDVADNYDDSAFDTEKALERKRNFICKFCTSKSSRQWRRAPNVSSALIIENNGKNKEKGIQYIVALCRRCAELWRRYAIQWEDMEELSKKVAASGGRAWKKRVDEELLKELTAANEMMTLTASTVPSASTTPGSAAAALQANPVDLPRKKLKTLADRDGEPSASDSGSMSGVILKKKEKAQEKPAPPPAPEIPKPRVLPCAICNQMSPPGDQTLLACKECRLSVHRRCYGVSDNRHPAKWTCDMCLNDKNPQISLEYKCVLCPVEFTEHDFVEPPRSTSTTKKKTEKEREKERLEREQAIKAADYYRKKQQDTNRPTNPREPLKRTADNNWVHVTCAVWTPEVRFGNARALSPSEGIPSIPRARYDLLCSACQRRGGACVQCPHPSCKSAVHVECAHQHGYLLGFEVTPVKGSRRDQFNIVSINGETGSMSALIWCKDHIPPKIVVHRMHDVVNPQDNQSTKESSTLNALQLYVQNFKQADLTLTGTVRKANLIAMATKTPATAPPVVDKNNINRRASTTTVPTTGPAVQRASSFDNSIDAAPIVQQTGDKVCITCGIDVSPKWWPIDKSHEKVLINGHYGSLGAEAQKFVAQRSFQCHKCKKTNRKPTPHVVPPPPPEVVLKIEQIHAPPAITAALASPGPAMPVPVPESRAALAQYSWAPPGQVGPPPSIPPSVAGPPLQAPSAAPPPPLPLSAPHPGPSPMAAPMPQGAPPPPHHYPPPSAPYGEWHRGPSQHPPPVHQMNGGPGGPNPLHPNHLRDLRPPPITPIPHHQATSLQHGPIGQPVVNGLPPSSPRRAPPVQNGGPAYLPPYHHQPPHSLHNLTNGGPPPRAAEHSFSQGLLTQRSPFTTPHGSPPASRDGLVMSREPSLSNSNPPPRPNDGRPPSGASASPSLRNLLS